MVDPGQQTGIAHYVLATALRHARALGTYAEQQRRGEWRRHPGRPLSRCRVGVLGLGEIGSAVARTFAAIGFPVAGWSRGGKGLPGVADFTGDDGTAALLAQSDILVCTLPLTPQTHGLLNRRTLSMLPAGAYFINVGRGEHVVEPDLLALLDAGHLAGAALDVFSKEPVEAGDPVWNHPRIEATPHIACDPSYELVAQQCVENLRRARRPAAAEHGGPGGGVLRQGGWRNAGAMQAPSAPVASPLQTDGLVQCDAVRITPAAPSPARGRGAGRAGAG